MCSSFLAEVGIYTTGISFLSGFLIVTHITRRKVTSEIETFSMSPVHGREQTWHCYLLRNFQQML